MKVAVIAHGIGMTKAISGEGKVYFSLFDMLQKRNVDYTAVSFCKPKFPIPSSYFFPFSIPKFDKYQRVLTLLPARKLRPKLFLNASGVPIPLSDIAPHVIYAGGPSISSIPSKYNRSLFWRLYLLPFSKIVKNFKKEAKRAKFIANSRYSSRAIKEVYDVESDVIYPPVDVEFYSKGFTESKSKEQFLTIARIERGKTLENSIYLSLKTGLKGIIIGSLIEREYHKKLIRMISRTGANVEILTNQPGEVIVEVMKETPVYFHPTIGEHFGTPVVEAMSAGLIPVVPMESGASEVSPWAYRDLEEAKDLVLNALKVPGSKRKELNVKAQEFRKDTFQEKMFSAISRYL
ncbi:glycosyltransferase family 4 protein [Metallosphaera sp.]|uniref:glycosyltransferase family 4 protein n=1 Tax=Metallosphaera sp. TaxID=2020860 RepID=UPI00316686CF